MRIITLREPAYCADCGAYLAAGVRARYYGKDKIYCEVHDHDAVAGGPSRRGAAPGPPAGPAAVAPGPPGGKGARDQIGAERASIAAEGDVIEIWIQFLEDVQAALTKVMHRLRDIE